MSIKAIVFDLDDTLYDEKDYVYSGFKAVDRWMRQQYKVAGFFETAAFLFESGLRELIFNRTLDELKVIYNGATIREMVDCYRTHQPRIRLFADARWVINHVRDDIILGLITDGHLIAQNQKVAALKLAELGKFQEIIMSDQWGKAAWKPNVKPYVEMKRRLALEHRECVYIGDNVHKDFIAANMLGWTTIQILRPKGLYPQAATDEYGAHYVVDDLRMIGDLPPLRHVFKQEVDNDYDKPGKQDLSVFTAHERQ